MEYQPIENYGIIGDLKTTALVGLNGSIDFMCFPNFDSPSLFACLLDKEKGGYFSIAPVFKEMKTKQLYLPDTNVLLTRFLSSEGVGEITDFMYTSGQPNEERQLIRRITVIRGNVTYRLRCSPRFNYGLDTHKVIQTGPNEICFQSNGKTNLKLALRSNIPVSIQGGDITAEFTLPANQTADFILDDPSLRQKDPQDVCAIVTQSLFRTVNYWKDWVSNCVYNGRWMETVSRSALVLKLLTSASYGSIIAAPTFSLPEYIGGRRNWDYRYTWIRDASFTVYSFIRLGYTKEAGAFMNWVEKICKDIKGNSRLGIMYSINGAAQLEEYVLDNFEGYRKSAPVRVGNDAYSQLQLDIYGELMDSVYLYNKHVEPISYDFWKDLETQMDWLAGNWQQPDDGIWEVRGGKNNFLYSRLACWVALDRAMKIAEQRSFPRNGNWKKERNKIYTSIFEEFWNDKELVTDSLVYRYNPQVASPDGLTSHEGTFSACTFWYVECLSRSGQLEKARFYFEKMLGYANHLGLYSEQLGFEGQHLGNFPQAFTHLALISAAHNLNKQLNDSRNKNVDDQYSGFPGQPDEWSNSNPAFARWPV